MKNSEDEGEGELTTIASATTTSKSLRSTIPRGIAKQFRLNVGDRLRWSIKAEDNRLVIVVAPVKGEKKGR